MLQENPSGIGYETQPAALPQEFDTHLTSDTIGVLWMHYMNATLSDCMLQHFLEQDEDQEIRQVIDRAQQVTSNQIDRIAQILESDDYPVPIGFTGSDVNPGAPRLYSDPFFLAYIRNLTRLALNAYGTALTISAREDTRQHFRQSVAETLEVEEMAVQTEKSKGLYVRGPYISPPERPEFAQNSDYLGSVFGTRRPLSAVEISNIFVACQNNLLGKALLMGFAQTAEARELREFFLRGKQIAHKHIEVLSALLINNDLPAPMSLDSYVTNSTVAPFSDKLMLQHTLAILQAGVMYYGVGLANIARMDVTGNYVRLMTEASNYLEDTAQLMIKYKWLEQPPLATDRHELVLH